MNHTASLSQGTTSTFRSARLERLGAIAGAGYVLLILVGNGLAGDVTMATDPTSFRVGSALEIMGFGCFVVFVAHLCTTLTRRDTSWLPMMSLVSGVATLAVKMATGAPWLVMADFRAGELNAGIAQALDDIGTVGFQMTFLTFGLFLVASAWSLRRGSLAGPWICWSGVLLGLAGIASVNLPFDSDVAAIPFLVSLLWLATVSVLLFLKAPSTVRHVTDAPH